MIINQSIKPGQPLWRCPLSDQDFNSLRQLLLRTKRLKDLDPRNCTLYYAEWWKRCYDGGFPSKREVFASISNSQDYNDEAFYQYAKRGAEMLRIKWIKNQNTLYFKTLLLQGGLPVRHISNNKSDYKALLLKLLELNPASVDDFAFNPHITSLLPPTSRNDEIFECCLSIVNAIIDNDQAYQYFFSTNESLSEISEELRIKQQRLQLVRRLPKFKSSWVFEPSKSLIWLYLGIPDLSTADLQQLFGINTDELDYEYKLYCDDLLLCKLIKKGETAFRIKWIGNNKLIWDGKDRIPDFYLMPPNGLKIDCPPLIAYMPDLRKPGLWTAYSQEQWVLEKGTHTAAKEGFVLYPADNTSSIAEAEMIELHDKPMYWARFEGSAIVYKDQTSYYFETSQRKIDWVIHDHRPGWLRRANMPVVRRKPAVSVFDETGERLNQRILKWRLKNTSIWNDWNNTLPMGMIELQIQAAGVTEYDCFYNIGILELITGSTSLGECAVKITGTEFVFLVNEGPQVGIRQDGPSDFTLFLKDRTHIPNAIQASLRTRSQRAGLLFEIAPPFKGVEILDKNGQIASPQHPLSLHGLQGMRLMCNQENLQVNIWNSRRPGMIISEPLPLGLIPLRNFGDKIMQLFALSDTMDGEAVIWLELYEDRGRTPVLVKKYMVQRYDRRITPACAPNGTLQIRLSRDHDIEMLAIPLDCPASTMTLRELERRDDHFEFDGDETLEKFVVFAKTTHLRVQPAFASRDQLNVPTDADDRKARVVELADQLLGATPEDDAWQRFLAYYNTCLDHHLPYSTFDMLRAIGYSSLLAAKAFAFLTCYDSREGFRDGAWEQMEQDLGLSFHWVSCTHWADAFLWVCGTDGTDVAEISTSLKAHLESLQPAQQFQKLVAYILQDRLPIIPASFHLNTRVNDLRSALGVRVINELPKNFPNIPVQYRQIIPVNSDNQNVEILLRAPLIVALSILGKDDALWHRDNEHKRRNIRYSQQLAPEWYAEALTYSINKSQTL